MKTNGYIVYPPGGTVVSTCSECAAQTIIPGSLFDFMGSDQESRDHLVCYRCFKPVLLDLDGYAHDNA